MPQGRSVFYARRQNKKVTVDFSVAMLDVIIGNEIRKSVRARACIAMTKTDFYFGF